MKITDIDTTVAFGGRRNWVVVRVRTDTELVGWGEATIEGRERSVRVVIDEMKERLIGHDPLAVEHHWQRLYRHQFWRGGPLTSTAIAGIDQALWDLRGMAWGVPVYRLLGGPTRDHVRLYTHVGIYQPEEMVADATRDVADGYTAMKTGSWRDDMLMPEQERVEKFVERVRTLREAVGPDVDIMIDDHGRGRPATAARLMRALEPFNLFFLEETTQPDDLESLVRIRHADPPMDIALGERLYSKWDYRPLLEQRLVDIIQPDPCHAGGISELKNIAALAEAYYVNLAPHNPQGPLSTAAAAHVAMAIPNFSILEYVRQDTYRDEAMRPKWLVDRGNLIVPDTPGLGVELDEDALAASPMKLPDRSEGPMRTEGSVADP